MARELALSCAREREFIIDDARYTRKIEEKYIEINRLEEIETGRETLFLTIEHAVTSCSIVIVNPYEEGGEHVRFDNARIGREKSPVAP